jgi:hypothetical protein
MQMIEFFKKYNITPEKAYSFHHIKTALNYCSKEMQIDIIQKNGYNIRYINNPSEKVQLTAVKQNGYAIAYIKKSTEKVQLIAVKKMEIIFNIPHCCINF